MRRLKGLACAVPIILKASLALAACAGVIGRSCRMALPLERASEWPSRALNMSRM
jgi:hypothetical protein